jgi:hypothetical protein
MIFFHSNSGFSSGGGTFFPRSAVKNKPNSSGWGEAANLESMVDGCRKRISERAELVGHPGKTIAKARI